MTTLTRPKSVATNDRGIPIYDGREVAAYRAARGVTQVEVAGRMRVAQSLIARYESGKAPLQEKWALKMLDVVDLVADLYNKLVARGIAELAAIRSARKATTR